MKTSRVKPNALLPCAKWTSVFARFVVAAAPCKARPAFTSGPYTSDVPAPDSSATKFIGCFEYSYDLDGGRETREVGPRPLRVRRRVEVDVGWKRVAAVAREQAPHVLGERLSGDLHLRGGEEVLPRHERRVTRGDGDLRRLQWLGGRRVVWSVDAGIRRPASSRVASAGDEDEGGTREGKYGKTTHGVR